MVGSLPAEALGLIEGQPGVVQPALVQEIGPTVRQIAKNEGRDCVDGELKLFLLL